MKFKLAGLDEKIIQLVEVRNWTPWQVLLRKLQKVSQEEGNEKMFVLKFIEAAVLTNYILTLKNLKRKSKHCQKGPRWMR